MDNTTSTPHLKYTPRVNFRSIESLAISSLNTSSLTPHSSPFSLQRNGKCDISPSPRHSTGWDSEQVSDSILVILWEPQDDHLLYHLDDTGYNSSNITFEKENIKPSRKVSDIE